MNNVELFSNKNTSFSKQQNPLKKFELPCDREYIQMNIGACSYFLLSEYPADVEVYISLNPEFKDAFKVDNRNTGFKIKEVYTPEGVPSFVKDVYLWTKGITKLTDAGGGAAKMRIVTSALYSFDILNNSSINSIASIGEIGKINSIGGYPAIAKVKTESGIGNADLAKLMIIDTDALNFFQKEKQYTFTFEMRFYGDFITNMMTNGGNIQLFCGMQNKSTGTFLFIATANIHAVWKGSAGGGMTINANTISGSLQLKGSYILDNLVVINPDTQESVLMIMTQGVFLPTAAQLQWSAQIAYYES